MGYAPSASPHGSNPCAGYNSSNSTSYSSHCHVLNASFPFMMAGLAAMVLLLFLSMAVLVCCYWRILAALEMVQGRATTSSSRSTEVRAAQGQIATKEGEERIAAARESDGSGKVVVIMAGDERPTFLALPILQQKPTTLVQSSNMV